MRKSDPLAQAAFFTTALAIVMLILIFSSNKSHNVDGIYKIVKAVHKSEKNSLRESTDYTVENSKGNTELRSSDYYDWPEDLPVGTVVKIENGDISVNGKPYRTPLEKFFEEEITKLLALLSIVTSLILYGMLLHRSQKAFTAP